MEHDQERPRPYGCVHSYIVAALITAGMLALVTLWTNAQSNADKEATNAPELQDKAEDKVTTYTSDINDLLSRGLNEAPSDDLTLEAQNKTNGCARSGQAGS